MTRLLLHNPADLGFDIVLLLGQSNMQGDSAGAVQANLDVTNGRVWMYGASGTYAGQIVQASDPLPHRGGSSVVGPGMEFARWYLQATPENRRVLLVPAAFNGTAMLSATPRWDPTTAWPNDSSNLYNLAIAQAQAALSAAGANSRIVAALWVQGEGDAIQGAAGTAYRTAFEYLIDGLRSRLSLPNLPFVIGSMTPEFIANYGAATASAIDAVHVATPTRKAYTAFVRGPAGLGRGDNLHYSPAGQRVQGRQLVGGYLTALANTTPASAVAPNPPTPPTPTLTNATAPVVTGSTPVGSVLTTTNGAWSSTPDSFTYQWNRAGAAIAGATSTSYTTVSGDLANAITCVVTAVKSGYTSGSATSNAITVTAAALTATDSFTRANSTSTLGTTETGGLTWQALTGTWGISGNQAYNAGGANGALAVVETSKSDHTAQVTIPTLDSGTSLVVRCSDATHLIAVLCSSPGGSYQVFRNTGSGFASVTVTGNTTYNVGDTIKCVMSGSTGTIFRNGTQVGTFTDSTTGTKVGIRADANTGRLAAFSLTA